MKLDSLLMGEKHDGRRKITTEQREQIKTMYEFERKGIREITRMIGCSRRSVQFILFPERLEIVKARAIEVKRWEPYNTKELRLEVMRKHRAKKRQLFTKGKLDISN